MSTSAIEKHSNEVALIITLTVQVAVSTRFKFLYDFQGFRTLSETTKLDPPFKLNVQFEARYLIRGLHSLVITSLTKNLMSHCMEGFIQWRNDGPFLWDPDIQGHILSSYFYGLASTQLLGGRMSELASAKYVLLIGTLLATIANTLIPALAVAFPSGYAVMVLQVFKGFGQGIMMPSFSVLMGKWVPPTERARFMSVIASGIPVGGFFTVVISGILCHSPTFGWEYVFYVFGVIAFVWCILWTVLIYDSPLNHPYITKRELNRIMSLRTQKAPIIVSTKNYFIV
ncbi:probable small intestine urate exporter [Trichonephila inaurata madagascariensis]|uniref:Probable small intestine urate exporter n=1 Tax=Trichonephila inaurata madagascariensis TaxID=2747483 RepID=A0A8X6Y616_9ARAC|nr:probable small intestine urate exporter [Trichonephila inaurata madagascariensis]